MTSPTTHALPRTFALPLAFISGIVALAARAAVKGRSKVEVKLVGAPAKEKLKAVVVSPVVPAPGGRPE